VVSEIEVQPSSGYILKRISSSWYSI